MSAVGNSALVCQYKSQIDAEWEVRKVKPVDRIKKRYIVFSILLFLVSLICPVMQWPYYIHYNSNGPDVPMMGFFALLFGPLGVCQFDFSWFANLTTAFIWFTFWTGKSPTKAAIAGLWLAATHLTYFCSKAVTLESVGYFVWLGSIILAALSAFTGPANEKNQIK